MKILRYVIAAIFFLICLKIGFATSRNIQASASRLANPSASMEESKMNISLSDQVSVLLIAVDDLTLPVPNLINIWWVAYSSNNPLTIITIYPALDDRKQNDHLMEKTFVLEHDKTGNRFLGDGMRRLFAEQDIPWSYYHIVDLTSLKAFQEVANLQNSVSGDIDWETMCWRMYAQSKEIDLNFFEDYFPQHSISEKSPKEVISFWQEVINRKDNRLCDFPQLQNSVLLTP